jgi:hypothetical protein
MGLKREEYNGYLIQMALGAICFKIWQKLKKINRKKQQGADIDPVNININ